MRRDTDSCISSALPFVLDVFSNVGIKKSNDNSVPESHLSTVMRYRKIRKEIMGRERSNSRRTIQEGLPLYQSSPGYFHFILAPLTKDFRLVRDDQFLPIDKGSSTLRGKSHRMDVDSLFALEALASGLMVM